MAESPLQIPAPPHDLPRTLGDLRASGWKSVPVSVRAAAQRGGQDRGRRPPDRGRARFRRHRDPQLENALLAGHDVILLGERGQAKTRLIRSLVNLLDEWLPVVTGSEINDDPYAPTSRFARLTVADGGDEDPDQLDPPQRPLRREAGHPRHVPSPT